VGTAKLLGGAGEGELMRQTFKQMKDEIAKIIPETVDYSVDLEAGDIVIVTTMLDRFTGSEGFLGTISKTIKKKVILRPDESIMLSEEETTKIIKEIISEDVEIRQIYFDECLRELIIQCDKPGNAIGRKAQI
jgi:hypothetical protein